MPYEVYITRRRCRFQIFIQLYSPNLKERDRGFEAGSLVKVEHIYYKSWNFNITIHQTKFI